MDLDGCSEGAGIQLALHLREQFCSVLPENCHLILNGCELIDKFLDGGFELVVDIGHFDCLSVGVCKKIWRRLRLAFGC
jgi:hypothetical protein